jgi:hypothetical protein
LIFGIRLQNQGKGFGFKGDGDFVTSRNGDHSSLILSAGMLVT